MKAKRLTALALAAVMAASSMSVSFAISTDEVLDFVDGELYYFDEDDNVIRSAEDDDYQFRPGDDIYLRLEGTETTSKKKSYSAFATWDIGKSWVDDVDIVYKKGEFNTGTNVTETTYTIQGFKDEYAVLNGTITFKSDKSDDATLIAKAKEAILKEAAKIDAIEAEVLKKYTDTKWKYGTNDDFATEADAKTEAEKDVKPKDGYTVDGGAWVAGTVPSNYKNTAKVYKTGTNSEHGTIEGALLASGWTLYTGADADGKGYCPATGDTGDSGLAYASDDGSYGGTPFTANNGVYLNAAKNKYIKTSATDLSAAITNVSANITITDDTTKKYNDDDTNDKVVAIVEVPHYFNSQDEDLGANEATAKTDNAKKVTSVVKYYTTTDKTTEAASKTEAELIVERVVRDTINALTRNNISKGETKVVSTKVAPTTAYAYWYKISTNKSATTKELDVVGTISVGTSKTNAKDHDWDIGFTLTNASSDPEHSDVSDYALIEPGAGGVLSFDKSAEEVEIEFGDDARFEFNARGQGKLNFAYNTKYNREFARDYESANIDFITFEGEPTANRTGTLYIYVDPEDKGYIYEVTEDGAKKISGAKYDKDEGAWVIRTRKLTSYAISDKKLKTVDEMGTSSSSGTTGGSTSRPNGSTGKPNPDTGR